MKPEISKLSNGLTVISDPMPQLESAMLGVWVNAGGRNETKPLMGVSHMLEHMAFKGTTTRSARDLAEQIEAVGGYLNAYTSREQTAFHARVLRADVPLGIELLADILVHPTFEQLELERERQVVLQEIGQALDTPDDIVFDHLQSAIYPEQPMGWPILGLAETVSAFTQDELRTYMNANYRAGGMTFVASGAVSHERVVELVADKFSGLKPGPTPAPLPARYIGGNIRFEEDLEQAHITYALPGVSASDPDFFVAQVYVTALGGGMSSRLFQEARERRGLCYAISAFAQASRDGGTINVYTGTGAAEAAEISAVIAGEMEKLATGADDAEVARAKAQMKSSLLMGLERPGQRAEQIAGQMFAYGRVLTMEELAEKLDAHRYRGGAPLRRSRHGGRQSGNRGRWSGRQARTLRRLCAPLRIGARAQRRRMNTGPMAFMRGLTFPGGQQPVIKAGAVYLRYPRMADFPAWARLRGESRAFLEPWEPVWASDELTKGAFRRRIKRYQKEARLDSAYAFFVFRYEDDALMGGCTLSNVRRGVTQCCALGYWVGERFARQGYMYDAVRALVPFIFTTLGLHRIEAACLPSNEPSKNLLTKAGFRQEGVALRYLQINGEWRDHVLFALLADEARVA